MYDMTVREFQGLSQTKGEVGIEIEMEGCDLPGERHVEDKSLWSYTHDGSLRGEALEYILKKPIPREDVLSALDQLREAFHRSGATLDPSNRCGVHVHLNMQEEKMIKVINLIILYLMFEDILVHWCGGEREGNLFCLRSKDAESLIIKIQWAIENERFTFDDSVRYASINILALGKFGSLEFRALPTRTDLSEIATWTEMLLCLKDAACEFNYPSEIISTLSGQGPAEFFHRIMKDKAEILEFPGYEAHILRAMRRVQPLAMMRELREGFSYSEPDRDKVENVRVADILAERYGRAAPRRAAARRAGIQPAPIPDPIPVFYDEDEGYLEDFIDEFPMDDEPDEDYR